MTSGFLAVLLLGASFHTVQVYAVSDEDAALDSVAALRTQGVDAYYLLEAGDDGSVRFKVRAGRYDDRAAAKKAGTTLARRLGMKEFFITTTDESEVKKLATAMEPLVEDRALTSGFLRKSDREQRAKAHIHNYLVLYLLASGGQTTGRSLRQAAVWDTNFENHREVLVVARDSSRKSSVEHGYVLYWEDGLYRLAHAVRGTEVEVYELWDLMPGPLRYIVFNTSDGGDLFQQREHVVVRWDADASTYAEVGRVPIERVDRGIDGQASHTYQAKATLQDFDEDQEMEVVATEEDGSARIYDWDGSRLRFLGDAQKLLDDWLANGRMPRALAASALLGIARAHAESGHWQEAEAAWRLLVLQMPDTHQAVLAKKALTDLVDRRQVAQVRTETALELLEAGNDAGAADELSHAIEVLPDFAPARYQLARAHARQGHAFKALMNLREAIAADPKYRSEAKNEPAFEKLENRREYRALMERASQ